MGRRGTGVETGLGAGRSADMTRGAGGNGVKKFRVPSAELALSAPTEVAAACNEEPGHHDGEDGRESSAE